MKFALFGFGTVGKGVYDILMEQGDMPVKYVLDLRPLPEVTQSKVTKDINEILSDGEVDTVIELIGGLHPAYEFVTSALRAGKNVISANKLLISLHYKELLDLAKENGVTLRFSAAAGGGIPWLVNLERAHRASTLHRVSGIMNGTTNYILDSMDTCGKDFAEALKEAQDLGFAEADPSSDIDGLDTRHKTTLSANIAFGVALDDEAVSSFGIRTVSAADLAICKEKGYMVKLIGTACRVGEKKDKVAAWVEPTLVPKDTPEGNIHGCDNIISFEGTHIGKTYFIGAGAGRYPTGYAVAQDCIDMARGLAGEYQSRMEEMEVANDSERHAYYLRTTFTQDPFFANLKKDAWGEGFMTEKVSVKEMHDFAKRAIDAGESVFFAGALSF